MKRFTTLLALLVFACLQFLYAQESQITGNVTSSEDGAPLPGVSIVIQGTTIGTVTDYDGNYSLTVPEDVQKLIFSFVGMVTQDITVDGRTTIDVVMDQDIVGLDEVVVTALGIKRSEKALGYAATTIDAEDIARTRTSDVMQSLAGKIAGVDITMSSSSPGASNAVIIRGMSSLGGSNQPLYVVDGVPILNTANFGGNPTNTLDFSYDFGAGNQMVNPDDVESVTILKGAAASALYGNRASNGVVLITTKAGQKNQDLKVEINSSFAMSDILRLPLYQNEFGMGWDGFHTMIENGSWGPRMDGSTRLWGTIYNNSQKLKPFTAKPDNIKDFYDYGYRFSNGVSVSGGSDQTTFYTSFSQTSDDGIVPTDNDSYDKYTVSLNGTHEYKKLTIRASAKLSRQFNKFVPTGQGFTTINNISQIPRDISIVSLRDYKTDPFDNLDYYFTPYGVINPYIALDLQSTDYKGQKLFGKIELEYEIIEGLDFTYRLGFDASDNESKRTFPRLVITPGTPNEGQVNEPGWSRKSMARRIETNQDFFFNFNKSVSDFQFNVVAGANLFSYEVSTSYSGVGNLDIPDFFDLSNTSETPSVNEYYAQKRLVGLYGNAEVAWKSMLYLTLTGRQDWSSTLPKDNNSYFYPGAQLSFVFSELLPGSLSNIISFGQARLAWGVTGKDADPYLLDPYFVAASLDNPFGDINFPLSTQNAFAVGNVLSNQNLQPEIRTESEVGLRMDFLQRRVGFDVALYDSKSEQQIYNLGLDYSTGYTSQTTNLGLIQNKGIELSVYGSPIRTSDFNWEVIVNYTKNNEKLVSLPKQLGDKVDLGGTTTISFVAQVGQPMGLFELTVPQKTADGKIVVNAGTGQPVAAAEKAIIPKAAFDYMVGISNIFSYKGLTLAFDFDIRKGGLIYSRTKDISLFTGNLKETTYNNRDPFVVLNSVNAIDDLDGVMDADGSATEDFVPNSTPIADDGLVTYWMNGYDKLDEAMLLPRDFVKLKRLSLGYTFNFNWMNTIGMENLTVSVFGNNLLLWTPEENYLIDPESSTFGNDLESKYGEFSVNPPTRSVGVNLNIVF